MRRPRSLIVRIGYVLEAVPIYMVFGLFRLIPPAAASAMAGFAARSLGPWLPISRRAYRNLQDSFPDMGRAEQRRVVREMWDNLGRLFAENTRIKATWDPTVVENAAGMDMGEKARAAADGTPLVLKGERVEIVGTEHFIRLLTHRGPAIVFTGHLGNWEMLPMGAARFGSYSAVIFRTPNNPHIARLIQRARRGLVRLLPKGMEGAVAAGRTLEEGGRLGFLADQKQNRGIAVPFFGRPAMTGTTLARLALKFDCPVYGAWVRRLGGRRFRITLTPPIEIPRTGDDEADTYAIMKQVNDRIESWVREAPGQWLWLHRRWPS